MPPQLDAITPLYSEDDVLRQIEQAILSHKLMPGTKLKDVELANLFGVKRGTIRKVLTKLANTRLVSQQPNRGAVVAKPSVKEGRDLFATRRVIESAILKILITLNNSDHIRKLRKILDNEQKAYQKEDRKRALDLSVDFHRKLAMMAGNSVMQDILEDIIRRTPLVILTHLGPDSENSCRNQEHEAIVSAIECGNLKKARRVMDEHLLHIETQLHHKTEEPQPELAALLLSV